MRKQQFHIQERQHWRLISFQKLPVFCRLPSDNSKPVFSEMCHWLIAKSNNNIKICVSKSKIKWNEIDKSNFFSDNKRGRERGRESSFVQHNSLNHFSFDLPTSFCQTSSTHRIPIKQRWIFTITEFYHNKTMRITKQQKPFTHTLEWINDDEKQKKQLCWIRQVSSHKATHRRKKNSQNENKTKK